MASVEGRAELAGAVDAILRQHRHAIEQVLEPLEEETELDAIVQHFQSNLLHLTQQEPAFWQLEIVEFISNVWRTQLSKSHADPETDGCEDDKRCRTEDPFAAYTSDGVKLTMATLVTQIEAEVKRWMLLLETCDSSKQRGKPGHVDMKDHRQDDTSQPAAFQCFDEFWELLTPEAPTLDLHPNEEGEEGDEYMFEHNAITSGGAYESITFDEFSDDCESARMGASLEDLPSIFTRLKSTQVTERSAALRELVAMPILEIVHCHMHFKALCSSIVSLFLEHEVQHEAMTLAYEILRHVEDPTAFMEVYCVILDFVGNQFSLGNMNLAQKNLLESDSKTLLIVNVYRFFLLMLARLPHHWIHFPSVALSGILYSSLRFLFMASKEPEELAYVPPIMIISCLDHRAEWFHTWMQKVPCQDQFFVALSESGFVNELMHHLARLRPLDLCKNQNCAIDATEKQFIQHVITILSYILEDSRGQSTIGTWRRPPAHEYQKHRSVEWISIDQLGIESREDENDRIYHVLQPSIKNTGDIAVLEDCAPLGSNAVSACILSIFAILMTHTTDGFEIWEESVLSSVSKYIASSGLIGGENTSVLDLVHGMMHLSVRPEADNSVTDNLLHAEWFPFREWSSPGQIVQLTLRVLQVLLENDTQVKPIVEDRSIQLLLVTVDAYHHTNKVSQIWIDKMTQTMKICTTNWIEMEVQQAVQVPFRRHGEQLLHHLGLLGKSPRVTMALQELGIVHDINALYQICVSGKNVELKHQLLECLVSMCSSTCALRELCESGVIEYYVKELLNQLKTMANWSIRKSTALLCLLCVPRVSSRVLTHDDLQHAVANLVSDLSAHLSTSLALNSPVEECPHELIPHFQMLTLLQSCLGTQYAVSSLQKCGHCSSSWQTFVFKTLRDHDNSCSSSTSAEDLCCVGFQLARSLTASIPSILICSPMLVDQNISVQNLNAVAESNPISSCSFLAIQFCRGFQRISGSRFKQDQLHLHEFDPNSFVSARVDVDETQTSSNAHDGVITHAVSLLLDKMLQSLASSQGESDIITLSQASWELITDIEKLATNKTQSSLQITTVFGRIMNEIVRSKRTFSLNMNKLTTDTKAIDFFPSGVQIKVMNQLYKRYCHQLGLKCSPTKLHFLIKSFGKRAMDCFPVTVLIILDQIGGDEQTILDFLAGIPNFNLLWPSQANDVIDTTKYQLSPLAVISEAAEMILELEFPHILQSLTRCHCTLLTLVLRWQSQCFWSYLDWDNIVIYVYLSVLYGAEFQVYAIIIMLKHLELPMQELGNRYPAQSSGAYLELVQRPLANFRFSPWRSLVSHLRNKYHDLVTHLLSTT